MENNDLQHFLWVELEGSLSKDLLDLRRKNLNAELIWELNAELLDDLTNFFNDDELDELYRQFMIWNRNIWVMK